MAKEKIYLAKKEEVDKHVSTHNLATYTSLDQIGLTVGSETISAIVTNLPESSKLLVAVDSTYNTSEYPNSKGNLLMECTCSCCGRARFLAVVDGTPKIWKGVFEEGEWLGWIEDLNTQNLPTPEQVGALSRTSLYKATLLSSGWSSSAPYTQTVSVSGIEETDKPIISCGEPSTLSSANFKSLNKAYSCVDRVVTSDGSITAYCYTKCPTVDIPLFIKI